MTTITITKAGIIEFDSPIEINTISLNFITSIKTLFNIPKRSAYTPLIGDIVIIPAGFYTFIELKKYIPSIKFNISTFQVSYDGAITGGLKDLINEDLMINLSPLCLYMYVDEIDTSKNYFKGKRSTLLSAIPMSNTNMTEIFTYQPINNVKQINKGEYSNIHIRLKDKWGHKYKGDFLAELVIH